MLAEIIARFHAQDAAWWGRRDYMYASAFAAGATVGACVTALACTFSPESTMPSEKDGHLKNKIDIFRMCPHS
jgi:hypothetical protein